LAKKIIPLPMRREKNLFLLCGNLPRKYGLCRELIVLNEDYKEILQILLNNEVNFLIVGAYAMGAYGYPRATGDFDIWVEASIENS